MLSTSAANPKVTNPEHSPLPAAKVWLVALLAGVSVAWPLLAAALVYGPQVTARSLAGDSYHYLAIARKAVISHIYTYDGVHVTNGFHPLWEYTIRAVFSLLNLQSHESQAAAVMLLALSASTIGIILASAAVIRLTRQYFLGVLLVPGLFYLTVGVHVRALWVWSTLDGMESAFSTLFGGIFFYTLSYYFRRTPNSTFDPVSTYRALGFVLPFIILSRLDDFFLLPALLVTLLFFNTSMKSRIVAALWIGGPSTIAILGYLIYNKMTVGAAMPLSGSTKSGFAGFLSTYLTAAVHFPPIFNLKSLLIRQPADGAVVMTNSFRFVEVIYPLIAAGFGALVLWIYRKKQAGVSILFAICTFIVFKTGYNFLMVHPWHQAGWYYALISLSLSVLGALVLQEPWVRLQSFPAAKYGVMILYVMLTLLSGSQYYASVAYAPSDSREDQFWARHNEMRNQLLAHGVSGIINVDDGITAFLLDFPCMHGFAFATDVEAQRANREGKMLSLAYARGINTIAGFEYLSADVPPTTDAEIRQYLKDNPLAGSIIRADIDSYEFSLAYYDPVLKMPFLSFKPK
jgi:hypothetical protein